MGPTAKKALPLSFARARLAQRAKGTPRATRPRECFHPRLTAASSRLSVSAWAGRGVAMARLELMRLNAVCDARLGD